MDKIWNQSELEKAKNIVLSHYDLVDNSPNAKLESALSRWTHKDCKFNFTEPFQEVVGASAAAKIFWEPLRNSFAPLQKAAEYFLSGAQSFVR